MPADDVSDDYVASILKRDAKASASRYASVGLSALLPSRPISGAPKPNTRFLKNILRETTSHNKALLEKEAQEAAARERDRRKQEARRESGRLTPPSYHNDRRSRKERPPKRRRLDEAEDDHPRRRSHREDGERHKRKREPSEDSTSGIDGVEDRARRRKRQERYHRRAQSENDSSEDSRNHSRGSNWTRHSRREHDRPYDSTPRSRSRSRSPKRHHKSRRKERHDREYKHDRHHSKRRRKSESPPRTLEEEPDADSDPLESIVGPLPRAPSPKVRARGRGAFKSSTMDAHFSANYDPSIDVEPPSDDNEDDFEQALEAYRDRQRWKQVGADRLKAAGFTDEQIRGWQKGGEEKERTEKDVRWNKRGEGREWDKGKTIDDDDGVAVESTFGRLKNT